MIQVVQHFHVIADEADGAQHRGLEPVRPLGAAGGPIAFLAGERLGAVTLLPPLTYGLLRLSVSWAIALVVFSSVVRRVAPERGADYKRIPQEWA
jgi:hypothetical protein